MHTYQLVHAVELVGGISAVVHLLYRSHRIVAEQRKRLAAKQTLINAYAILDRDRQSHIMEQREEIEANAARGYNIFDAEIPLYCVVARGRMGGNIRVTHIGDLTKQQCEEYAQGMNNARSPHADGTHGITYVVAEYRCRPTEE